MSTVIVSDRIYPSLKEALVKKHSLLELTPLGQLYEGVGDHGDLHCHKCGEKLYVSKELQLYIEETGIILPGKYEVIVQELGGKYPGTVPLNAISGADYLIANRNAVAKEILEVHEKLGHRIYHVKQGYVRCTTLPVSDSLLITDDEGIYRSLVASGDWNGWAYEEAAIRTMTSDVCAGSEKAIILVRRGDILLPGFAGGFFGGCCGVVEDVLYVNGDLAIHRDASIIEEIVHAICMEIVDVPDQPLVDVGGIMLFT